MPAIYRCFGLVLLEILKFLADFTGAQNYNKELSAANYERKVVYFDFEKEGARIQRPTANVQGGPVLK